VVVGTASAMHPGMVLAVKSLKAGCLKFSFPRSGTTGARIAAMAMMLLLVFGGATMPVASWLNLTFLVMQTTTGHEEEEEQRHTGKCTRSTCGRNDRIPDNSKRSARGTIICGLAVSHRLPTLAKLTTHRDADLRNGIGTSLRC